MPVDISLLQKVIPFIKSNIDTIASFAGPAVKETYRLPGYGTNIEKRSSSNAELSESEKAFMQELKGISTMNIKLTDEEFKMFFYKLSLDKCRKPVGITISNCAEISDSVSKLLDRVTVLKTVSTTTIGPAAPQPVAPQPVAPQPAAPRPSTPTSILKRSGSPKKPKKGLTFINKNGKTPLTTSTIIT